MGLESEHALKAPSASERAQAAAPGVTTVDADAAADAELSALFAQHADYVYRVLRRLGASEADAEDLCQDVFIIVQRKLAEFAGRSSMRTWIYGICIRVASNYRRQRSRKRARQDEVSTVAAVEREAGRAAPSGKRAVVARQLLDRLLDALPDGQREVLVLYEIEQLSLAEVAEALECPAGTVASRLRAARTSLERAAAQLGIPGGEK